MTAWSVHRLARSLGAHAAAWDALNDRRFRSHPLLSSRFVEGLLAHFGSGDEHLCIRRCPGGEPQAMCIVLPKRPGVWALFLPSQAQIGPALVREPDELDGLIGAFPGMALQLDLLCVDPAFSDVGEATALTKPVDHALTINISLQASFDEYWGTRSKKLQGNFRRWARRAADDGLQLTFRRAERPAEVAAAVARYGALETQGWKGRMGTALGSDTQQQDFYSHLLVGAAEQGQALVYELWFGERLAASRLLLIDNGMIVALKTTYDEALQAYAPGRLLLHELIRDAHDRSPGGVIEFYTNATSDQLAWATGQRAIRHVTLFRNRLAVRASEWLRHLRAKTAATVPSEPQAATALPVESFTHPDEMPVDAQALLADAERDSVDLGLAWYRNFVDAVAREAGVRFYVLRDGGAPLAVLPVVVRTGRMRLHRKVDALSNYYSALYAPALDPAVTAAQLATLFREVARRHAPVAAWRLEPMDPKGIAYRKVLDGLRAAGLRACESFCFGNWFLRVEGDFAAYFAARPGEVRSTVRRMQKKLAHDGGRVEIIRDAADLPRGLAAYQQVYASSWKRQEPFPEFIPGLMAACAERGWLRLGVVWLGDRAIAAQLWIVAHGKASIYKLAYDEAFKGYSPGTVLTAHLMRHVIDDERVAEVDYLIGDDAYKKHWMAERRERWRVVAYDPRTVGGLLYLLRQRLTDPVSRESSALGAPHAARR